MSSTPNLVSVNEELWEDIEDEILLTAENTTATLRYSKACNDLRPPFQDYTHSGYLCVTDLTSQRWCEQKLVYTRTIPMDVMEKPAMTAGSHIHLARELEVHDIVRINVKTAEDKWAVRLLNVVQFVTGIHAGEKVSREVPVISEPYNAGVLVHGVIDEVRFDPEQHSIDIVELKTRQCHQVPGASQMSQHSLQMRLYKKIFDDMVRGLVDKQMLADKLCLDLNKTFSDEIIGHARLFTRDVTNLSQLWDVMMMHMQCLTCVDKLYVEYVHQESGETIRYVSVDYNDDDLCKEFHEYMKFWKGERSARGVDIEDAWKCGQCEYSDVCGWRHARDKECMEKNRCH